MKSAYEDILHHAYPYPSGRPHMSRHDRAAQFAPFAALTGYHERIRELEREKTVRPSLSEDEAADLDDKLRMLQEHLPESPAAVIHFFRTEGSSGSVETVTGTVKRIDPALRTLTLADGLQLSLDDILRIEAGF